MYTSVPLAEAQPRSGVDEGPRRVEATQSDPTPAAAAVAHQVPVVDMDFEDIPEQSYEDFAFRLPTTPEMVYVLGIDDDTVLFEILDFTKEGSASEIIDFFFESTFRRVLYADTGLEVDNGYKLLCQTIDDRPKNGKPVSRKYLMGVVTTAIDRWSEELTDTSMRPNRASRRARRRKR